MDKTNAELLDRIKLLEQENQYLKNTISRAPVSNAPPKKIAEQNIQDQHNIYQYILEFLPYPVIVHEDDGRIVFLNPAFTHTFGWTLSELKNNLPAFIPEERVSETRQVMKQFMDEKTLIQFETQRKTKDGRILDIFIWAKAHFEFNHNFVIMRDITEEKRLEANTRTISRISNALPEHPELLDLMNYISKEIKELLNTEGAIVLLYDEIKEELFYQGAYYEDSATRKRAKAFRFSLDDVRAGQIIKTGIPLIINEKDAKDKDWDNRDIRLGYETRSLMEVPIKSGDRIIGVFCAVNKKQNTFDQNDVELLTMIAANCAISIENARFAQAVHEAYRDVASLNRARGKVINHLSHELKTPVAVMAGSIKILKKKILGFPETKAESTLARIERNIERIVEIQEETCDIMEGKTYPARQMLLGLFDDCKDELETLICQAGAPDSLLDEVEKMMNEKFGPRTVTFKDIKLDEFFRQLYSTLVPKFEFRKLDINIQNPKNLPKLHLPEEIIDKVFTGLLRNAIENTPDQGRIDIHLSLSNEAIGFEIHDFGVGIEPDAQKRIFEGFFANQETLFYSTKKPFAFNAGGKGADLLRMKIFSKRYAFTLTMESGRCIYLHENKNFECPGDIEKCTFCQSKADCSKSGGSVFKVSFLL